MKKLLVIARVERNYGSCAKEKDKLATVSRTIIHIQIGAFCSTPVEDLWMLQDHGTRELLSHSYSFWSSSLNLDFSCSLFILRAAVTKPDSGVHGSGSNLILAGVSNLSNLEAFATCRDRMLSDLQKGFCFFLYIY